jgi:hypothetical protein
MARDLLRVWLKLDHIDCYDEGDGWGDAEPYLWTVFFKIDGDSVALTDALTLSGSATVVSTPGSHGNLGTSDVDAGDDVPIPGAIGEWGPFLKPIPVPPDLKPLVGDDLGGVVGVVTVLMEEDNVTDDGAEAGHAALNQAVQSALDDIIATRTFSNPDITEADIDAYLSAIQDAVTDAIKDQQNFFENLWSFLNADDVIGSRVFYFKHDDLAGGATIALSQRWRNEGDWELFGSIHASVACTAAGLAAASDVLGALFGDAEGGMRAFRDQEIGRHAHLAAWWSLIDRNAPQLIAAITGDDELLHSAAALFPLAGVVGARHHERIGDEHVDAAERILHRLHATGGRRARLDASRMLSLTPHLRGRTVEEAIELLAAVGPARHPRPSKDVRHLLRDDVRTPSSLAQAPQR